MGKMKGKNHHPVATKVVYAFCVGLSALVFPGCATEAQVRIYNPGKRSDSRKSRHRYKEIPRHAVWMGRTTKLVG